VDPKLTKLTLVHFTTCAIAFVIGWRCLVETRYSSWFWTPLLIGFLYVLFSGFDQHNGGLDATREAFYAQPDWRTYPPEYLLKMQSNRIFGSLVYPNALAQLIILLFPISLWQFWELTARWRRMARLVVVGLFAYLALGCLYWTGSKGGWLVALMTGAVLFLHLRVQPKLKWICVSAGLVFGILLFFIRFNAYFEKGATSVGARFTYWDAAVKTAATHPVFGSGPGTFSVPYKQLKPADAEMAKLTHNDYLEQASDSGIPGALAFSGFFLGSLVLLYRKSLEIGPAAFLMWLGLLGWALQAFIEFGLYIPALSWPMFAFCGLLWGIPAKDKGRNTGLFVAR
jgi:O-antigen ligase